jgi:hypothetical protein
LSASTAALLVDSLRDRKEILGNAHDAQRTRDLLAARRPRQAVSVPALGQLRERERDLLG